MKINSVIPGFDVEFLSEALINLQAALRDLALDRQFLSRLMATYGSSINRATVGQLQQQWLNNDFSAIPDFEVQPAQLLSGADAIFSKVENKIRLSHDYLVGMRLQPLAIANTLLREVDKFVGSVATQPSNSSQEGITTAVSSKQLSSNLSKTVVSERDLINRNLSSQPPQITNSKVTISDSGGFEGSQKTITLMSNKGGGYVEYSYQHFTIPDNFIIRYEGKNIFQTGFVGGGRSGRVKIPKGNSNQLEVIVATNDQGTAWEYTATADSCPDTTPLNVEAASGEFEDKDGDGDCEAQGTIFVGRLDGIQQMLRAENASAEYDTTTFRLIDGVVFGQIGGIPTPLFKGSFSTPFKTRRGSITESGSAPNEFKLAGLDVVFQSIELVSNQARFGAEFSLPAKITGQAIKIPLRPSNLTGLILTQNNVLLGVNAKVPLPAPPSFRLFNLLNVSASDLKVGYNVTENELKIQGKLTVDKFTKAVGASFQADLTGNNFIRVKDGDADFVGVLSVRNLRLPRGWGIDDLSLTLDTINNRVEGDAAIRFPFGRSAALFKRSAAGAGVGVGFQNGELTTVKGSVVLPAPGIPVASTGFFLESVNGSVNNLAPSSSDPIEFQGGAKFVSRLLAGLASIEIDGKINDEQASGNAQFELISKTIASANGTGTLNWNKRSLEIGGQFSLIDNFVSASLNVKADTKLNFNTSGLGKVNVPSSIPLIGGKSFASANILIDFSNDGSLANDYAAAWSTFSTPFGSITAGAKGRFDRTFEFIGPRNIPSLAQTNSQTATRSFAATGRTSLILSADWQNPSSSVQVQVKRPDGRLISESEFAANNIALINDFNDSDTRAVIVSNPAAGNWELQVVNPTGLGAITYSAFETTVAPTIQITAPTADISGDIVNIGYRAIDADSNATVKLFYDTDNIGFDGILIDGNLTETDSSSTYSWNTQGITPGNYYVYALAVDENNAPVFSNYSSGRVRVTNQADVSIESSASANPVRLGDNLVYRLTVKNNSSSLAKGIKLTNSLPEGAALISTSPAPTQQNDNDLLFDLGDLASGQTRVVEITVAPSAAGTFFNTASITTQSYDPDATNDSTSLAAEVADLPTPAVDLALTTASPISPVNLGDTISYTLTATNAGSATANNVIVTDNLPLFNVINVSASSSQGFAALDGNGNLVAQLGSLSGGQSATINITAKAVGAGDFTNTATITSGEDDLDLLNNTLDQDRTVNAIAPSPADLELSKTVSNSNPTIGEIITFTTTLSNKGPGIASGIKVTDLLPIGLTFVSAAPAQGTYDSRTGIWDVGNMRDNLSRTLQIQATVSTGGTFSSKAEVIAVNELDPDSTPGNNVLGEDDLASVLITAGLSGKGGQRTFVVRQGEQRVITEFGGVGKGTNPPEAVIAEADTLKLEGTGLIARNMLLTKSGTDLVITFDGDATTRVTLKDFALENLDNLIRSLGLSVNLNNIFFNDQTSVQDNFDVFDANSTQQLIFNANSVTFLNDLNNSVKGYPLSSDVINGQGGDDRIEGLSGADLLRGGLGNDTLIGGLGADQLTGNNGNDNLLGGYGDDQLTGGSGADRFIFDVNTAFSLLPSPGIDSLTDFSQAETDRIVLDKTTFTALQSRVGRGFSRADEFAVVVSDAAVNRSAAKIVYNSANGKLFYNQNGAAAGLGVGGNFAVLTGNPSLAASDFVLQA
jgi:uncharacterized repeat protein (TIGR01451 family)